MKIRRRDYIFHSNGTRKISQKFYRKRNNHRKCYIVGERDARTFSHGVDWNPSSTTIDFNRRFNILKDKRIVSVQNQFNKDDDYFSRYSHFLQYSNKRSIIYSLNNQLSDVQNIPQGQFIEDFYNKNFSQVEKEWIGIKEYVSTTSRNCPHHTQDSFDSLVSKLVFDSTIRTSCGKDNDDTNNIFALPIVSRCSKQLCADSCNDEDKIKMVCSEFSEFLSIFGVGQVSATDFPYFDLRFEDLESQNINVDPIHMFRIFFFHYLDFLRNETSHSHIMEIVKSFCNAIFNIPIMYTVFNRHIFLHLELFCSSLAHLSNMYSKYVLSVFFQAIMYWTKQLLVMKYNSCATLKPVIVLYFFFSLVNAGSEDNISLITLGLSLVAEILSRFVFQNFIEVLYVLLLIDVVFQAVSELNLILPDILTFLVDFTSLYSLSCFSKNSNYLKFAKLQIFSKLSIIDIPLPERHGTQWIFPTDCIHSDQFISSLVLYRALYHISTYLQGTHLNSHFLGICPNISEILTHLQSHENLPRAFHDCIEASMTILSTPSPWYNSFQLFKSSSKSIRFLKLETPRKFCSTSQPLQSSKAYNREYKLSLRIIRIRNALLSNKLVNEEVLVDRNRLERVKAIYQLIPDEIPN